MIFELIFISSFIISLILLGRFYKVRKANFSKVVIQMTWLVSVWLLMEVSCFIVKSYDLRMLFEKVKFIDITLIPPFFFISASQIAKIKQEFKASEKLLLLIIPFLSITSLVKENFPYRFISNIMFKDVNGIPEFIFSKNTGFLIHMAYSYILILLGLYFLMLRVLKAPRLYRKQSALIFIGVVLSFLVNVLFTTQVFGEFPIDSTSIAMLAALIVYYWGLFLVPKTVLASTARDLVIENIKDIVIILDTSGCIIDANPAAVEFLRTYGRNKNAEKVNKMNLSGLKMSDALEYVPNLRKLEGTADAAGESTVVYNAGIKTFYFRMYESVIYDFNKDQIGKLYMFHDITELQDYVNNLQLLNEELTISDKIINDTLEGVLITDINGVITRVNSAFERISGYSKEELIGKTPRLLKSDRHEAGFYKDMWDEIKIKGYWEGEIWDRKKSGEIYPKWMSITAIYFPNGKFANYISISSDISKIKKVENDLISLSYYDSLTGIPNRALFYERLGRSLVRNKRNGKIVALLLMDLDRFKVINDTMGHAAGDMLLMEVTNRIRIRIRESDTISRIGGDEFAVILEDINTSDDVKKVADSIMREISRPYFIMGREVTIGISIGIAFAPFDENAIEGLVRKADAAMYHSKETGRGKYSFFSEEIEKKNQEILEMQIKLGAAISNNEFKLYLQPQMAFNGGGYELIGAEALIRWRTNSGKVYTPDKFIPVSENNGMIVPIGNWVLEEIFRLDRLLGENGINIKLSINVSVKQFENGGFIERVKEVIAQNPTQDIRLTVEITESMLINDIERTIEYLNKLKQMGIGIALDDFGTGFSCLSYINRLPLDYLKIDKAFVANMDNNNDRDLTSTIISMAKTLKLRTIAEGVETIGQIDKLIKDGCNELQGYYFSKPVEFEEFVEFAKKFKHTEL